LRDPSRPHADPMAWEISRRGPLPRPRYWPGFVGKDKDFPLLIATKKTARNLFLFAEKLVN
jgi:hypothetical protein